LKVDDPVYAVRDCALALAGADTHTPVTYWLSIPLIELSEWIDTIEKFQKKRKRGAR
jgi:hypothetical protein